MRRLLLKICYDGTDFCGWQVQPNGLTVQEVLCAALFDLLGEKVNVTGCSRTDAGVHAHEFYCHFDTENEKIDLGGFVGGLNVRLPKSVAVLGCFNVSDDFHARYDAAGKEYVYKMYHSRVRNPFLDKYALQLPVEPDVEKVSQFCKKLIGTHDFAAFSASGREYDTTVRTIYNCDFVNNNGVYTLSVSGDGFLYNMVRIIVGTALFVSEGKISVDDIEGLFEKGDRSLLGPTAPAKGLALNKVFYEEGKFNNG